MWSLNEGENMDKIEIVKNRHFWLEIRNLLNWMGLPRVNIWILCVTFYKNHNFIKMHSKWAIWLKKLRNSKKHVEIPIFPKKKLTCKCECYHQYFGWGLEICCWSTMMMMNDEPLDKNSTQKAGYQQPSFYFQINISLRHALSR